MCIQHILQIGGFAMHEKRNRKSAGSIGALDYQTFKPKRAAANVDPKERIFL
jgi:hypothetical protein